ncbi:hypothetical protein [Streptomyces sp. ID05-47C]|nr:hypothetical protein [Streptomyces sp. ID05-47C]MDX3567983.1 hypothetical protein [Streptomyces sp. ID05-47C]
MAGQDAKLGFDVQWRNDLRRLARCHEYRTAVIDAVVDLVGTVRGLTGRA